MLKNMRQNVYDYSCYIPFIILFVIFLLVIWFMVHKINLLENNFKNGEKTIKHIGSSMSSINGNNAKYNHSLWEYYIKSSFNSVMGGNITNDFADERQLKIAIQSGARFIDLEIWKVNNSPVVAFGPYKLNDAARLKGSYNHIPLSVVLSTINTHAFSSTAPTSNDPLFILFRMKTKDRTMYNIMADNLKRSGLLSRALSSKYKYNGKYSPQPSLVEEKLLNLKNKVIILCYHDGDSTKSFRDTKFEEYVNLGGKNKDIQFVTDSEAKTKDTAKQIDNNKKMLSVIINTSGGKFKNTDFNTFSKKGFSVIPMSHANTDSNYKLSVKEFKHSAFILKDAKFRKIKKQDTMDTKEISEQKTKNSYAPRNIQLPMVKFQI
jgi:hypothetical protein